jgi:hypothetical protein
VDRQLRPPDRPDDEHRRDRRRTRDVVEQLDGGGVGPLEIVDHEHAAAVRGRLLDQGAERLEAAKARGVGVAGRDLGQVAELAHRLEERVERRPALLRAPAAQHGRALLVGLPGEPRGQARLADRRIAGEHDHAPLAAGHGPPCRLEGAELSLAAYEAESVAPGELRWQHGATLTRT